MASSCLTAERLPGTTNVPGSFTEAKKVSRKVIVGEQAGTTRSEPCVMSRARVHISLINGYWRVMTGDNSRLTLAYAAPAISFCRRLNEEQRRLPKVPAGYTAEELERDNPYNARSQE